MESVFLIVWVCCTSRVLCDEFWLKFWSIVFSRLVFSLAERRRNFQSVVLKKSDSGKPPVSVVDTEKLQRVYQLEHKCNYFPQLQ
jgi:hypothetical protein